MTYDRFTNYLRDAAEIGDEERFRAEVGYPADMLYSPEDYIKIMHIIHIAACGTFKDLVEDRNMSAFSRYYGIPYRTLQHWVSGERSAPPYVMQLIAFAMINDIPTEELD